MKNFTKLLSGLVLILGSLLTFTFFSAPSDQNQLQIIFFDVGQGDSILIKTPYQQKILIDGGPDTTVIEKLGKYLPFYDKEIDLMILTHPHADHVTGLVEVLERYQVNKILTSGAVHTSAAYLSWLSEIKNQNIPVEIADGYRLIELGEDLKLEILYPLLDFSGQAVDNLNNVSVVAKLVYKNNSFLLTGDAELEAEEALLASGLDLKADVLKVGHHGSSTSTSQLFLETVEPDIAVISAGRDNDYGHPSFRTIRRLDRFDAIVYRTDLDGDIELTSDGNNLNVNK
ncbi:MAG TPA: MBL fold metallo-hydrolase [Patescibacteria group bacterium]